MSYKPNANSLPLLLVGLLILVLVLVLAACGPSKCEQAGGELVFSHYLYIPITHYNAATKTSWVQMTMVPQYRCEVPS